MDWRMVGSAYFSPICLTMLLMVGWKSSFMASWVSRSIPWDDHFTMFMLTNTNTVSRGGVTVTADEAPPTHLLLLSAASTLCPLCLL